MRRSENHLSLLVLFAPVFLLLLALSPPGPAAAESAPQWIDIATFTDPYVPLWDATGGDWREPTTQVPQALTASLENATAPDPPSGADAEVRLLDTTPPVFNIWYGTDQHFATLGVPQTWINILGNVTDTETAITSLVYSLNGVPSGTPLSIGKDNRRLAEHGDFNVEIATTALSIGSNTVVITATNSDSLESTATVNVTYGGAGPWPLPYFIDWSTVTDTQRAVQVVDGQWSFTASGIRTQQIAYDRILAIGEFATWDDYQVLVPITIHAIDESAYDIPQSVGPGLGIILRWAGHTNDPVVCSQPHCGWKPQGSSNWYEWRRSILDRLQLTAEPPNGFVSTTSRQFEIGHTYWYKVRANTNASGTLYRFKVWEDGVETEPANWTLLRQADPTNKAQGSLLLVAHHVDATFGDVAVTPLSVTLGVNTVGSGTVEIDPDIPEYPYETTVTLTATATGGSEFVGWSGDLAGITDTVVTMTMNANKVVTATFEVPTAITLADFRANGISGQNRIHPVFLAALLLVALGGILLQPFAIIRPGIDRPPPNPGIDP